MCCGLLFVFVVGGIVFFETFSFCIFVFYVVGMMGAKKKWLKFFFFFFFFF